MKQIFTKLIKSEECLELLAHCTDGRQESLLNHLLLTVERARENSNKVVKKVAERLELDEKVVTHLIENAVFLHDIGKATPYFQYYKMNNGKRPKEYNHELSKHSQLSSVFYFEEMVSYLQKNKVATPHYFLLTFVLMECIAKHHSNLADLISFSEAIDHYLNELNLSENREEVFRYFSVTPRLLKSRHFFNQKVNEWLATCSLGFKKELHVVGLLCFSLLTTADILATKEFSQGFSFQRDEYQGEVKVALNRTYQNSKLNQLILNYQEPKVKQLNDFRSEFILDLDQQLKKIQSSAYLFHIEGIVGIGKTHAAQRFALHMLNQGATRVFWGVPYLAIATQVNTANQKLDPFSVQLDSRTQIREEFSNGKIDYRQMVINDQLMNYRQATISFVRFFNLLFGRSKADALKRLALMDSIIILDEIQSIDVLLMNYFLDQIESLAQLLNMKVLFMSATLQRFERSMSLTQAEKYRKEPLLSQRNKLDFSYFEGYDQLAVLNQIEPEKQRILVQCVTKKQAQKIEGVLREKGLTVALYTGETPTAERLEIIEKLKSKDREGNYICSEIILITTNAIEAGVDISMNMAIVDLTTSDALEQLSGRVNRHHEFPPETAKIYLINVENATFLSPIKTTVTRGMPPEKLGQLFENKNYNEFMTKVIQLAKVDKKYSEQTTSFENIAFQSLSQQMKLITTNGCFYYHIRDETASNLMHAYQECVTKIREDITQYDEYYIKKRKIQIELEAYRHEIKDYKIKQAFLNDYSDELIVFYEHEETYEAQYLKQKGGC